MELLKNLTYGLIILIVLASIFVMQSISVELAQKKGYNKLQATFLGLVPVVGLLYYLRKPIVKYGATKELVRLSYRPKEVLHKYLVYSELIVVGVIVLIPIIYILGASLNGISALPTTIWPEQVTMKNFINLLWGEDVWVDGDFMANLKSIIWGHNSNYPKSDLDPLKYNLKDLLQLRYRSDFIAWFFNTIGIAIVNMVVGVVFITGAAYVFARYKFKGKRIGLITIMVLQVFPSFMGLIAMYTLFETFGLLGQPLALSILYIGGAVPFNMWVIKGYLMNIPKDLDESAMIDGANKLHIFFRIILPLSVPIISFVAVSLFMSPWMDYMLPGFILRTRVGSNPVEKQFTIAVGLFDMISGTNSEYTTFAAGAVLVSLPITVLYMIFQRYLIEGITAGSTKG